MHAFPRRLQACVRLMCHSSPTPHLPSQALGTLVMCRGEQANSFVVENARLTPTVRLFQTGLPHSFSNLQEQALDCLQTFHYCFPIFSNNNMCASTTAAGSPYSIVSFRGLELCDWRRTLGREERGRRKNTDLPGGGSNFLPGGEAGRRAVFVTEEELTKVVLAHWGFSAGCQHCHVCLCLQFYLPDSSCSCHCMGRRRLREAVQAGCLPAGCWESFHHATCLSLPTYHSPCQLLHFHPYHPWVVVVTGGTALCIIPF